MHALVIDDDATARATVRMSLEDHGFDVEAPDHTFSDVEALLALASEVDADVTICDHRLQPGRMAPFFGAEAVERMVSMSRVAVLMTSYFDTDYDTTIRLHKRGIPSWISREELQEPEPLLNLIETVRREIGGTLEPARQLHETIIRVGDVGDEGQALMFDVFIDGWRPDQAVRVPAAAVPPEIADLGRDLIGRQLLAEVNLEAAKSSQLYFGSISGPIAPRAWPATQSGPGTTFERPATQRVD